MNLGRQSIDGRDICSQRATRFLYESCLTQESADIARLVCARPILLFDILKASSSYHLESVPRKGNEELVRKTAITECRWVGEQVLARSPDEARDACRAIDIVKPRHDQAWSRSRIDHTARKRSYGNVMNVRCSLAIGRNCLKTRRRELIDVQLRDQRDDWPRHVFGAMFAASRESNDSSGFSTLNPTAMPLTSR